MADANVKLTWAAARVHIGILLSSVSIWKRSSPDAMNEDSTSTLEVFSDFFSALITLGAGATALADDDVEGAAGAETGVPVRDGSPDGVGVPPIWRSLPWVSTNTTANSANFASSAAGRRFFASVNSLSTAAEESVVKVQLYCICFQNMSGKVGR